MPERIAALETAIGQQLPEDVKESLRLHEGQAGGDCLAGSCPSSEVGYELLDLDGILADWSSWKGLIDEGEFANDQSNPAKGIRSSWWHSGWIPIASNGGGDSLWYRPGPRGRRNCRPGHHHES